MPQCWAPLAVCVSLALAGCYQPPDACRIRCDDTSGCPGDMTCIEGYCRPEDPALCAEPPVEWASVTAGAFHTCGLSTYNDILCWGSNASGQLGLGAAVDEAHEPTRVDDAKWLAVTAGVHHTCGLRDDGSAWCWGENEHGQVKGERGTQFVTPTRVTIDPMRPAPPFQAIAAAHRHTCAIGNGELWCWGHPQQVGVDVTAATRIGMDATWTAVSTGYDHTCAIRDGQLYCWGANDFGQLGEPPAGAVAAPKLVDLGGLQVLAVSAGAETTCAIASAVPGAATGELWCWGRNDRKLLDDTSIDSGTPRRMGSLDTWRAVEVGFGLACAIGGDGAMACWGESSRGALGHGLWNDTRTFDNATTPGLADEVTLPLRTTTAGAPALAAEFACARTGTALACWGQNTHGELGLGNSAQKNRPVLVAPPDGTTWASLRAGANHVCATTSTGELHCWGADFSAQISAGIARGTTNPCLPSEPCNFPRPTKAPADITRFDDVVLGNAYTCMRDDTVIKCWGASNDGALGADLDRGFATVLAPPGSQWTKLWGGTRGNCGLTTMGRVACWGFFGGQVATRPAVQMSTEIRDIGDARFGDDLLCMLRTTDSARVCWGRNETYQLGDGTNIYATTPRALDLQTIAAVAVHGAHGCAITVAGAVTCWGSNGSGESNNTDPAAVMSPQTVMGPDGALAGCTKVAVGRVHSCAICGGTVHCWGEDFYGATGVPDTAAPDSVPVAVTVENETFVDIAARAHGTCALTAAGNIYCWGESTHGANGDGGQARNIPTDITTRF